VIDREQVHDGADSAIAALADMLAEADQRLPRLRVVNGEEEDEDGD